MPIEEISQCPQCHASVVGMHICWMVIAKQMAAHCKKLEAELERFRRQDG